MDPPAPSVVRCAYVVPNKGRRCRFPVVPGSVWCGAHREEGGEQSQKRIPCPLDPNHTVFQHRLKQHLKVCTKVRDQHVIEKQPFYKQGVNLGSTSIPSN
ncbi:unnamed protein product [Durusdinium trenchii]|uniref:tRNA:m(4)X modification enzyme TRM13 n=1 Tax=Durusdinium trenchii TaxID=1381693 RepID=A0ABP0NNW2_9DINO